MTLSTIAATRQRAPELYAQTVVVIGGSSGIGLETARRARTEGADVIVTGRDPDRLGNAAEELGALYSVAFDAFDSAALERFFRDLPKPIDQVMVTAGGPYYMPLREMNLAQAVRHVDELLMLILQVAREAIDRVRPGGSVLFVSGTARGSAWRSLPCSRRRCLRSSPRWRWSSHRCG